MFNKFHLKHIYITFEIYIVFSAQTFSNETYRMDLNN